MMELANLIIFLLPCSKELDRISAIMIYFILVISWSALIQDLNNMDLGFYKQVT
jgi:hypothetical protein